MKTAFDVSSSIYGTGVSDYIANLVPRLSSTQTFGYSLRRQSDLRRLFPKALVFPFPPIAMHYLWNKLHILPVENLTGPADIYHSSDWTQAPSLAKKVTTIHDLAPFLYPAETSQQIVAVHTARMQWVDKECDKIICVSQNTANDMIKLFPETSSRLVVIPESLPTRFLLNPEPLNLESYVVAIGTRQPRKNITRLISACSKLSQKLIIIGEKPNNLTIQQFNNTTFTGYISDQSLVNYLAGAEAFVYPSLYEGFGLPILGAFYHQVPVACSNTSSLPEVAGNAAVFFDPLDEDSIANGIISAIKNRKKLISLGTQQLQKFSWSNAAAETMKVYESLL